MIPGSGRVAQWLGVSLPSEQNYLGNECLSWIQDRIQTCCNSHSHNVLDRGFIPARLLDVTHQQPKLVHRAELKSASRVKYAALSYCWGSAADSQRQTKTTAATLPQRVAGLQDAEMTAVLRDAVRTTRALSIPYLWIDALCILQGSTPDWEENCRDMDKIYGSAHVTLCAASSTSCHEGFLSPRGLRLRLPFQSYRRADVRGSYEIQFKYARCLQTTEPPDVLGYDLTFCRWAYRAWTFQEKALSTRQVLFGNSGIHFLCENTHESMGDEPKEPATDTRFQTTNTVTSATPTQLSQSWETLLSLYSAFDETALTHASDILPALAGLARLFQQRLNDTYICGHWQTTLFHDLMWTLSHKLYAPTRETHLAKLPARTSRLLPSWSRLLQSRPTINRFTPGGSSSPFRALRPEYQRLIPDVALAGSNPLGAVRHARLRLTTVLLEPTGMAMHNEPSLGEGEEHCGFKWHADFGGDRYLDAESPSPMVFRLDRRVEGAASEFDRYTSSEVWGVEEMRWALLGSCEMRADGGRAAFGLVLHAVPGEVGRYWRVGAFVPSNAGRHGDSLALFRRVGRVETVEVV